MDYLQSFVNILTMYGIYGLLIGILGFFSYFITKRTTLVYFYERYYKFRKPLNEYKISKGEIDDVKRICERYRLRIVEFRKFITKCGYDIVDNTSNTNTPVLRDDQNRNVNNQRLNPSTLPFEVDLNSDEINSILIDIKNIEKIDGKLEILEKYDHKLRNTISNLDTENRMSTYLNLLNYLKEISVKDNRIREFYLKILDSCSNSVNNPLKEFLFENSLYFDDLWNHKRESLSNNEIKYVYFIRLNLNSNNFVFLKSCIYQLINIEIISEPIFDIILKNFVSTISGFLQKNPDEIRMIRVDLMNKKHEINLNTNIKNRIANIIEKL